MKEQIENSLQKGLVSTKVLLAHAKLLNTNSNSSLEFLDKRYLPFYYHLGKHINPSSVIQMKPKLGLPALCFLQGCKTVNKWTILGDFNRFVSANVKLKMDVDFVKDSSQSYDAAFVSESFSKEDLNKLWSLLNDEGLLIADYISENAVFQEFGDTHSREVIKFDTRYGIGLIRK